MDTFLKKHEKEMQSSVSTSAMKPLDTERKHRRYLNSEGTFRKINLTFFFYYLWYKIIHLGLQKKLGRIMLLNKPCYRLGEFGTQYLQRKDSYSKKFQLLRNAPLIMPVMHLSLVAAKAASVITSQHAGVSCGEVII